MESIAKTVVETTIADHIETELSTTAPETMEDEVHKEATLETIVTSSVEATVTETIEEEVAKADDLVMDDLEALDNDDEAISAMIDETATEPETVKVETVATAATKGSLSPLKAEEAKVSESTISMETEQEEKECTSSSSPPLSATDTDNNEKYPPRKTRAQSQEVRQNPTTSKKNAKSKSTEAVRSKSTEKQSSIEAETVKEEKDEDESEYEVEKIEGHRTYKGKVVKYEIKWKNYPQEDNTMEAASTIHDDVPELCIAYWDSLTNITRPSNAPVRNSVDSATSSGSNTPIPTASKEIKKEQEDHNTTVQQALEKKSPRKRERAEDDVDDSKISKRVKKYIDHVPGYMVKLGYQFPTLWPIQTTNWEKELRKICVQASPVDENTMLCYIEWFNDQKTIHTMDEVHEKIPTALINYYEERLQFV